MKLSDCHLGFIGFGHMAQTMMHALDRAKLIPHRNIHFVQRDAHKMKENEKKYKITGTSLKNLIETSDLLLLAVRPNQTELIFKEMEQLKVAPSKMFITMVAGVRFSYYKK